MNAPVLTTPRLRLRPYDMGDFPAYAGFVTSARTGHMGGPHDLGTAWNWFCNDVAGWALMGMGGLMAERQGGAPVGHVAICQLPHYPEPELGWFLFAGCEGQGYASEAAAALRDWGFAVRGLKTLVSYIDAANARSIALALRLGAVLDPAAATPDDQPTGVYRYAA